MAPKPPDAARINKRAAKDRAFLKRALKNPGLRSKLDPKYLSKPQQASRALNVRLNAPITPGSSTTERDLAHAAQAATTVRYGPQESQLGQQLGVAQQTQRDTGSFYDQYLQNLQQHSQNVAMFQQGAQQALAQTGAGITGLSGAQGAELQQTANQGAVPGMGPAGDLSGMASNAAAVRQALVGSFQAQQAQTGAANNIYADTQAHVVGPGQKLAALAQAAGRTKDVRTRIGDLKAEEGAFNQQFRDTRRQDEFKNVLAQQTLTGNQAIAGAKAATAAAASSPEGVSATSSARAEGSTAAKYGYSVHDWRMLGPKGRQAVIAKAKKSGGGGGSDTRYTSGPFAGMLKSEVNAMSPTRAQRIVDNYNKSKGKKPGEKGAGPKWQTQGAQSTARQQTSSLKSYAQKAKAGQPFVAGHAKGKPLSRHEAALKIQQSVAAPADPILLTAALDAAYDGHLSPATVRALIAAGYKPGLISQALGVPTAGQQPRGGASNRTSRPGTGGAQART